MNESPRKRLALITGVTGQDGAYLAEFLLKNGAAIFLMQEYSSEEIVNVSVGRDVTIAELAQLVKEAVGFEVDLKYDTSKPDATPRKLLDVGKLNALGWHAKVELEEGIAATCTWFKQHYGL